MNAFVFPAPPSSYRCRDLVRNMLFVPRCASRKSGTDFALPSPAGDVAHIPCYRSECRAGSSKIVLYFHGNAEDVGKATELLDSFRDELGVHVIAMEYVGYGIYSGEPTADAISADAFNVYDYINKKMGWEEENIVLFGRSIGTAFATQVAAARNPGMLILMSGFTSIKDVVKQTACMLAFMVADRLRSIDLVPAVKCPKLFLHGLKDELVPPVLAEALYRASKEPKRAYYGKNMSHNEFEFYEDLVVPVTEYMRECTIDVRPTKSNNMLPAVGQELPPEFKAKSAKDNRWSCSI